MSVPADRREGPSEGMAPADRALVDAIPPHRRAANGVPGPGRERRMRRAYDSVAAALGPSAVIRHSPLGPGWSEDLDVHGDVAPHLPAELGWVPLDTLLTRLGHPGRGRWAVVADGRVLARAEIHAAPPPEPVAAVLARSWRRGGVRAREVLELRSLRRSGHRLPSGDPALAVAARVEAGLGGDELSPWASGPPLPHPSPLPEDAAARLLRRARRAAGRWRRLVRPRVAVALSGVDGAGKSTLAARLVEDLERVGVPATVVWTRPGMRLSWLEGAAGAAKRLLGQVAAPGVERVARGEAPARLASRRGILGWAWTLLVTLSFLLDVRRRHSAAAGVVVFDRHELDALATLDAFYAGVDTRLHRALVRSLLPRASVTVYLDVSAREAVDRKRDDAFGELAVGRQLAAYATTLPQIPRAVVLDGRRPADELALEVVRVVASGAGR
jgi:thymidylate kinase